MDIQGPVTSPTVPYVPLGVGLALIALSNVLQYLQVSSSLSEYGGSGLMTLISGMHSFGMVIATLGAVAAGIRIGLLSLRPDGTTQI